MEEEIIYELYDFAIGNISYKNKKPCRAVVISDPYYANYELDVGQSLILPIILTALITKKGVRPQDVLCAGTYCDDTGMATILRYDKKFDISRVPKILKRQRMIDQAYLKSNIYNGAMMINYNDFYYTRLSNVF
ncbi:MAG: hypothetical protein LBD94_01215 [Rickettsiales bacterium]|jgi:hypothetical protein|nr:hypothetical protein [Rickettsiales bacterium]